LSGKFSLVNLKFIWRTMAKSRYTWRQGHTNFMGTSWPWSYGSWIYNYLCNQWCCEFESRSGPGVQYYVIKFVSDLQQVRGFLWFPPPIKLTATT
jgi:hypothetical protein